MNRNQKLLVVMVLYPVVTVLVALFLAVSRQRSGPAGYLWTLPLAIFCGRLFARAVRRWLNR